MLKILVCSLIFGCSADSQTLLRKDKKTTLQFQNKFCNYNDNRKRNLKIMNLNEILIDVKKAARKVFCILGSGFLEKVYQNALIFELRKLNLSVEKEKIVFVYYDELNSYMI